MPGKRTIWQGFITATLLVLLLIPARVTMAQTSGGTNPQCPTLPSTINVWIANYLSEWPPNSSEYQTMSFEDYVYGVIMGELGSVITGGPYAGNAWGDEVLKAQSVAARTWGAYWCRKWTFPNGLKGVQDSVPDQVYRPYRFGNPTKQRYIDVSYAMRDIYISYDGLLLQAPTMASCSMQSTAAIPIILRVPGLYQLLYERP